MIFLSLQESSDPCQERRLRNENLEGKTASAKTRLASGYILVFALFEVFILPGCSLWLKVTRRECCFSLGETPADGCGKASPSALRPEVKQVVKYLSLR